MIKSFLIAIVVTFLIITIATTCVKHSTLMGHTHTIADIEYPCAKSDDTLWLCFERFETWLGFKDMRVAFEYNPQTQTIGKIAPNSNYYVQSIRM